MDIWKKVKKTSSCWLWLGEINKKGYGRIQANSKRMSAHRFFYELLVQKTPIGLEIDHLCRNRKCINPAHLEAVTHGENIRRAWAERIKSKPNCPNGHPYSGTNLYVIIDKKNKKKWRTCKSCRVEANRRWRSN